MRDPVCGMEVVPAQAAAQAQYEGETYYFCARACKALFDKDPARFLHPLAAFPAHARALYAALRALSQAVYGAPAGQALGEAEWEALRVLGERGECRMRELAAACGVALSTATGLVDRLVAKGLVQRRHGESDRRLVLVRLTGRGRLLYQERLEADMRLVLGMLQPLGAREQRQLVALLEKIVRALPQAAGPGRSDDAEHATHDAAS
ncbi:MAG: hypothetical protein KatS3mg131_1392 [Candidatus Tectimicrobiota bacterium]|nr:MAG: hypothetical protein KatS3mg131_1392 [Candidatus Tectomicrobia bacterium]